jgi:hypothetical protein
MKKLSSLSCALLNLDRQLFRVHVSMNVEN